MSIITADVGTPTVVNVNYLISFANGKQGIKGDGTFVSYVAGMAT